jgi:pyruvate/2-oxoglutarate dehydrogenase complex dihydrolipoamide acyltransferase (E2) component
MSELIEIRIEDPGNTEEVEVVEIAVEPGQTVAQGERLLEVETDKANMDLEAPAGGVVEEIRVAEGDVVAVSQVFAVLRT